MVLETGSGTRDRRLDIRREEFELCAGDVKGLRQSGWGWGAALQQGRDSDTIAHVSSPLVCIKQVLSLK